MSLSREDYHDATPSTATPSADEASLHLGPLVSEEGTSGIVYELIGEDALLYKKYRLPVGPRHAQRLSELIAWRETLDDQSRETLDWHSAWPRKLITRDDDVAGFLMNRAPAQFWFRAVSQGEEQQLTRDLTKHLNRVGPPRFPVPTPSFRERLALAGDLAAFLDLLNRYQIVYGDLGPLNVLWAVHPRPSVYLIDCDNARPADFSPGDSGIEVTTQAGGWSDPRPTPHGYPTIDSDRYALAYFYCRVVYQFEPPDPARQLTSADPAPPAAVIPPFDQWPGLPPGVHRLGELERYLAEGLYGTQERRPSADDWMRAIDRVLTREPDLSHTLGYDQSPGGEREPRRVVPWHARLDSWLIGGCVACAVGGLALGLGIRPVIWSDRAPSVPASSPTPAKTRPPAAPSVRVIKPSPAKPSEHALNVSDDDSVQAIAFGDGDTKLATGDADHAVYLWDAATLPDASRQAPVPLSDDVAAETTSSSRGVNAAAFNPAGTEVAAGDKNGYAYVWNVSDNGRPSFTVHDDNTNNDGVHGVAFSSGGTLATGDGDGDVYLWSSDGTSPCGQELCVARDPENRGLSPEVLGVAFNPEGTLVAAADHDGAVYLWNEASVVAGEAQQPSVSLTVPDGGAVQAVAFSHDGKYLAAGDADGNTYIWSTANWRLVHTVTDAGGTVTTAESTDGEAGITSLAFSQDDLVLATGDIDGGVYLWNMTDGTRIARLADPETSGVNAVAFAPGGKFLLAGDGNGSVYQWPMSWLSY